MKRVNIHLAEADLALLDSQAVTAGISRSEFLRNRVLNSVNGKNYSPKQYQQLVAAAQRRSNVPRAQVEQLVNFLFIEFMAPHGEEANQH
jgi:hypothetical protein